uniref:Uncharacterized protein n=1 Tax=Nelumbo nucifera TaxID=4432 RepID=A0A822XAE7_NELNU|nr:TPA_asm: hypothetical protein HUJ06_019877 [Nelumbo nucifera]
MKLSSHSQRPQILAPLLDLESRETEFEKREEPLTRGRDLRLRSGSLHPLDLEDSENKQIETSSTGTTPSVSASSSKSSSSGRNSKRWKFWSLISFSPGKEKKSSSTSLPFSLSSKEKKSSVKTVAGKPANDVNKHRTPPSPDELHYTANKAQAEEIRKPLGVFCFCRLGIRM